MMAGFPYLNLLQRTDPGTVSAAAAVSASRSKVLMAGRHFLFFPLPATPEQMHRAPRRACQWGPLFFFNYSISAQAEGGRGRDL